MCQLWVVHLGTKSIKDIFSPEPYNNSVFTLRIEKIIQSEREKRVENQISDQKFYNMSDFEMINLQRVRFWVKNFITSPIFTQVFHNASVFELKIQNVSVFEKEFAFKKLRFHSFYYVKSTNFAFFVLFCKAWFWVKIFETCQIFTWKFFSTCQILNWRFYNVSVFEYTFFAVCQIFMRHSNQCSFR